MTTYTFGGFTAKIEYLTKDDSFVGEKLTLFNEFYFEPDKAPEFSYHLSDPEGFAILDKPRDLSIDFDGKNIVNSRYEFIVQNVEWSEGRNNYSTTMLIGGKSELLPGGQSYTIKFLLIPIAGDSLTWIRNEDNFSKFLNDSTFAPVPAKLGPNKTIAFDDLDYKAFDEGFVKKGDFITGTKKSDILIGSRGNDTIFGGDGDDVIAGLKGSDDLDGGKGFNTVTYDRDSQFAPRTGVIVNLAEGRATDAVGHQDRLTNFSAVIGSDKNDTLKGDSAHNNLFGGKGKDVIEGAGGRDTLKGGQDNDQIRGGKGADTLEGDGGDDQLIGGSESDNLDGGTGDDILSGGKQRDRLDGGKGDDVLTGGKHADTFVFEAKFGNDVITDFETGRKHDTIDLSGVVQIRSARDLFKNHVTELKNSVMIDDGDGHTIEIMNVSLDQLSDSHFVF